MQIQAMPITKPSKDNRKASNTCSELYLSFSTFVVLTF
jgi:hypothetical protein